MGGDSCSKGRGFESLHYILDGHFSHIFAVKIYNVCLKRQKINEKEAGVDPFFKQKGVWIYFKRLTTFLSTLYNFYSKTPSQWICHLCVQLWTRSQETKLQFLFFHSKVKRKNGENQDKRQAKKINQISSGGKINWRLVSTMAVVIFQILALSEGRRRKTILRMF